MENLKKYMDKVIMGICVVLFIFMLIMGSYQIISRYILKDPSTISEIGNIFFYLDVNVCRSLCIWKKRTYEHGIFCGEIF